MPIAARRFSVGVVSREHVHLGVKGGFIQLNHGKKAPIQRLRTGDGVVMYSPRRVRVPRECDLAEVNRTRRFMFPT